MDWDQVVKDLRFALAAAEAIVFLPIMALALVALVALGIDYINPVWRQKRRQIEQRTDLPADALDALFKSVRNPLYTMFNVTGGLCLVVGVASVVGGLGTLLYGVLLARSQFLVGIGSAVLILGMLLVGLWFVVTGVCHMTMARTVVTEECVNRLAEFEGEKSEASVSVPESRIRYYRWRGLKIFVVSLLILTGFWMSGYGKTIASSLDLIMGNWPVGG